MESNVFTLMFDFFEKILEMFNSFKSFLLSSVTIGGEEISVWALLGSGLLVGVLVFLIVKVII